MKIEEIEGNKLVAEFMEWTIEPGMELEEDPYYNAPVKPVYIPAMFLASKLRFNTSWDWLMPVAQKIKKYAVPEQKTAWQQDVLETKAMKLWEAIAYASACLNIEMLWISVVEFIKWYNVKSK